MSANPRCCPLVSDRSVASFLLGLVLVLSSVATPVSGSGLDSAPLVDPYFDGTFPLVAPGDGSDTTWRVVPAYPHLVFDNPLVYTPLRNSDLVFVGSRDGNIEYFVNDPETTTKTQFLDLRSITAVVWDGGFLGMDFHPEFGQGTGKDYLFVYHSARPENGEYPTGSTSDFFGTYLRLARYDVDPVTMVADPESEVQLFNIRLYNGSHRGGGLLFAPDGLLYLSIGDQFRYETAQDIAGNFEGGVIRIDVDMDPSRSHPPRRFMGVDVGEEDEFTGNEYWIPNDNPFLDPAGGIFEEFWVLGNRAPHRMTYDAVTGRFWSGEIGYATREEINIIDGGRNYGWPFREGTVAGERPEPPSYLGLLTEPVIDFVRSDAVAIIGGYVYRGTELPSLTGKFLAGDYGTSKIWAITYDEMTGQGTAEYLCQFDPGLLATFGQDLDGEVYLCGLGPDRPIYKLQQVVSNGPAPATLSATGFFTNLDSLVVTPQAIPYDINLTFWSDFAQKKRWAIVPFDGSPNTVDERIGYAPTRSWTFPEGTVLVKHFDFPVDDTDPTVTRRLETRFLVNGYKGAVYGLTYKWRADQTDADLLGTGGVTEDIVIATEGGTRTQSWRYPSRGECLTCHNAAAGFSLGLNARQLNRDFTYESTGRTENQLVTLSSVRLIEESITPADVDAIPHLSAIDDETAPLQDRARSYLDANCSHCHQPGTGNRAAFDARFDTDLQFQNLVRGDVLEDLGIGGAQLIAPQDVDRSLIHRRMSSRQPGVAMPQIASSVADSAGAALLARWIELLDADYPVNVARGRPASQSSTWWDRVASRAVDGDTNGDLDQGSVTETAYEPNAWWQVDLGSAVEIDEVVLWNRTDCCDDLLSDFWIFVSPVPFAYDEPESSLAIAGVTSLFHPGPVAVSERFGVDTVGRYVRVQLTGQDALQLAEVQVFSPNWPSAPIERPVLGNAIVGGGVSPTGSSNLVINETDGYENVESGSVRLRIDEFAFEAFQSADPITPFVAQREPGGEYTVLAIGSTRLPDEYVVGPNVFAFDAIEAPTVNVGPGRTLVTGFIDAFPDGSGGGAGAVIPYTETGATDLNWWTGGVNGSATGRVVLGAKPIAGALVTTEQLRDYHYSVSFTRMQSVSGPSVGTDGDAPVGPVRMRLAAPAPNPFNPSTVLRMRLDRAARVHWAIYDVRGRLITTLADGEMTAGEHVRVWDGTDAHGRSIASGVYFQRVVGDGTQDGNKLVLVK